MKADLAASSGSIDGTDPPESLGIATPDLASDPDTQLARASVMSGLFGEQPGVPRIGRYPIFARLGQGAMGVVYACYDAQLDRRIAVKVLRADIESASVRARMVREAQAMAMLSHPNVAHVYEVGEHDGRLFVAMELVKGQTLRDWLQASPRRWRDVLSVCLAAGRGLAAAHDKGLTHRDYKPDNVMVGDDGRVRVMDFGLVRVDAKPAIEESLEETPPAFSEDAPAELTRSGSLVGTPAYMAPEQLLDAEAGPLADQFAYCVTLWEALYGQRPFFGKTLPDLAASLRNGRIVEPSAATKVPSWVRRVLGRGLRVDASERFSTMAELLAEFERGHARATTRRVFAAIGVLALLGAGAEGSRRYVRAQAIAACEAAGASIAESWNDNARAQLRDALLATRVSYAETTAEKVMPWLDSQATAWQHARAEACLDTEVRAVWGADTLDRSLWCLDERRMELEALVGELSRGDDSIVQKAVGAAAGLSSVDACRDADLLERLPPPPVERREEARAIRVELAVADALDRTGEYADGLELARSARARAESLGWPPLLAAARTREARLLGQQGAYAEAEQASAQAYFDAAHVGAWDVAAAAASRLAFVVGNRLGRHDDGLVWGEHAALALAHAGDPEGLREAARLGGLASVQFAAGAYAEARTLHERALAIRETALGAEHPDVAGTLGNLAHAHHATGDYAQARTLVERALAIKVSALGPDHPDIAVSLDNLASLHVVTGEYAQARTLYERALVVFEQALGPDHFDVGNCLNNLGAVHHAIGEYAEARPLFERALTIREQALGPTHSLVAETIHNLASVENATGDHALAVKLYERALGLQEKALGPDHPELSKGLDNLAAARTGAGEYAQARSLYERSLAITVKAVGPDHPDVARSLSGLATVHSATGDHDGAVRVLERALVIYDLHDGNQENELWSRFALAKALVASGGDRSRARALAEQARDGWRVTGVTDALTEAEAWLSEHAGTP